MTRTERAYMAQLVARVVTEQATKPGDLYPKRDCRRRPSPSGNSSYPRDPRGARISGELAPEKALGMTHQLCRACSSVGRHEIDLALAEGASVRQVAARWGLSASAVKLVFFIAMNCFSNSQKH